MHDDDDLNQSEFVDGTDVASAPLEAEIAGAAALVDVGDASAMLVAVRSASDRRRRRRNAVVGIAAAGLLVGSGVIVAELADGGSGDDLIVSAPDTAVPASDPADSVLTSVDASSVDAAVSSEPSSAPSTGSFESADSSADAAEVVEAVESPAVDPLPVRLIPSSAEELGESVAADSGGENLLFAWKDGFLSIGTMFEPQPLPPELPQEVIDAFPPEVVEFFPDGLPATIEEAMEQLQEAGLLDEVSDIVLNNPEVSDAIYSQRVEPQRSVRVSADGIDWTEVEASFPEGDLGLYNAASTGERFAFATVIYDDQLTESAGTPGLGPTASAVEVHSTTDLITWTTQSIPLMEPLATDSLVHQQTHLNSFAATDAGYVLSVERSIDIDVVPLLDAELQERAASSGFGISYGDRGVTVSFDQVVNDGGADQDGGPETYTFTWEELGVDTPPTESMSSERWVGTWNGGAPVLADATDNADWIVAVGDDFVELGPTPRRSSDGFTWEQIDLPEGGFADMIVETPTGMALWMSDRSGGGTIYTGDLATGDWAPLETPGLPRSVQPAGEGSGGFLLAQYGDDRVDDPFVDSIGSLTTAEVDGYRYELETTGEGDDMTSTYTVTDVESGAVVATETSDDIIDGSPFEHVDENSGFGGAFTVLDPESGDALVTIPYESMRHQVINADGSLTDLANVGPEPSGAWRAPGLWVLAALDDGWTLQQVSDGSDEERYAAGMVVVGDVALVGWPDGSFTRVAPS